MSVGDPDRTQSQPHEVLSPALPFLCQGFPLVALSTRMDLIFPQFQQGREVASSQFGSLQP